MKYDDKLTFEEKVALDLKREEMIEEYHGRRIDAGITMGLGQQAVSKYLEGRKK